LFSLKVEDCLTPQVEQRNKAPTLTLAATTVNTFVKVHEHVRSNRRDLLSPYSLDSTFRVALMCAFRKLDHHGA